MPYKEGLSEVDLIISFDKSVILLEAKYLAPLSKSTTHCATRNQLIRYIDIAINHYLYDAENPKEVYFVVLTSTKIKPWLIRYYRNPQRIFNEVTRSSMFADYTKASKTISKRIGWINWETIRVILETSKNYFQETAERKFTDDLINYLEYKQNEAERLRNERSVIDTQFSLKL
jgi:phage terminase large subunit-like protein